VRQRLREILDGNTFVLSDARGDIAASPSSPTGFFSFDTRFLSLWRLSLNGDQLNPLAAESVEYFHNRFFLVPGAPTHYVDAKTSIVRERTIAQGGFEERLTVLSQYDQPMDYTLRLEARGDFADVVQVKVGEEAPRAGSYRAVAEDGTLTLSYRRARYERQTRITTDGSAQVDERGLTFSFRLARNQKWRATVWVRAIVVGARGRDLRDTLTAHRPGGFRQLELDLAEWRDRAPRLDTDKPALDRAYQRSLNDLAALRYATLAFPDQPVPTAGLPWYMTIYGRDTILTSLQALPFAPELSAGTLRLLAIEQGTHVDDFRDEEPGKILLELRYGETAAFEERPESPYFGTADSTMLFLILLDEYERWSGDVDLVRDLEPEARAAIGWIDDYADLMGDGYVWYQTRNPRYGLQNQGWKTASDAISFRNGRLPALPRATCELQGYTYDAKLRTARLARLVWNDPALADRLERAAADLKRRFNRDFWIEEREYYALALDGEGAQVDALSSNIGHLLWSGIVDEARAAAVAGHLLGPRLFSGWGVRTLAEGEARYNPVGFHVGTVWPFDNAFIAWGLRRYGFKAEAGRITEAMLDAAPYFQGRLPEALAGYDRKLTGYPVRQPSACNLQALSTGTPLLLLRTMLGLEPYADKLLVDPAVPARLGRISLTGIPGRWGRWNAFARGRIDVQQTESPPPDPRTSRRVR
jgi:glycogen debranching enzyme